MRIEQRHRDAGKDLDDMLYAHHVIKYDPAAAQRCAEQAFARFEATLRTSQDASGLAGERIWLWRNGAHEFVAYDNPFPCHPGPGDPLTLGEPAGWAYLNASENGRPDYPIAQVERDVARTALRHTPDTDSVRTWQSIEIAPKDGTRVIVCKWAWVYEDIVEAFKAGHEPARQVWHLHFATTAFFLADKGYWTDGLEKLVEPTHWMPLPAAPVSESEG